ncbi:MAG: NADPH:quinone reductase [Burkholderiaceae bacterium]
MRAAWYDRNGPAEEVLQFGEQPTPTPGPGEVRIRLAFSGVNPSDTKSRAGSRPVLEGIVIPHSDGAGVIDSVGAGVAATRVGERVWTWNAQYKRPHGTAAEYVVLPAEQAVPLPEGTSFEVGACLGIPGLTAHHAVELAELGPGQTVLVIGGASAVSFYAAQIARARGARVITTVGSQEKAAHLHQAGFPETILYKQESTAQRALSLTDGAGVNAIIDMDLSSSYSLVDDGVLATHGRYVCFGSNTRGPVPIDYAVWLFRSLSLRFFLVYDLTPAQRTNAVNGLHALLREGKLQHNIGAVFPLQQLIDAHHAVEQGILGNVVIDCS